jgi:hypothetical protein
MPAQPQEILQVLSGQHCSISEQQSLPQHVVPEVQQWVLLQQVSANEQHLLPQHVP